MACGGGTAHTAALLLLTPLLLTLLLYCRCSWYSPNMTYVGAQFLERSIRNVLLSNAGSVA
jgi:hypothetical protein